MADITVPFGFPYPEATDLVRDGAADIEALADGVNDHLVKGFVFAGVVGRGEDSTFDMNQPFGPSGPTLTIRYLRVQIVGGGGGSGGCAATGVGEFAISSGGNGGEYGIRDYFPSAIVDLPETVDIVVGAGGIGATLGNDDATDGGGSSFHEQTVVGGERGRSALTPNTNVSFPRFRSTAGVGINNRVIPGSVGVVGSLSAPNRVSGSQGGGSHLSAHGNSGALGVAIPAVSGSTVGGGAAGATNAESQAARVGAAGSGGFVIVEVFI